LPKFQTLLLKPFITAAKMQIHKFRTDIDTGEPKRQTQPKFDMFWDATCTAPPMQGEAPMATERGECMADKDVYMADKDVYMADSIKPMADSGEGMSSGH
jgi:hypothetical protein